MTTTLATALAATESSGGTDTSAVVLLGVTALLMVGYLIYLLPD
jgi:hypothetical protein